MTKNKVKGKVKELAKKYKKVAGYTLGAIVVVGGLCLWHEHYLNSVGYVDSVAKEFCATKKNPKGCKCMLRALRMYASKEDYRKAMGYAKDKDTDMMFSIFTKTRNEVGRVLEGFVDSCSED